MKCPHCPNDLDRTRDRAVETHRCAGCRGEWLVAKEVERLEVHRGTGPLASHLERATETTLACPECATMLRAVKAGPIELDACPSCNGLWLDAGELQSLREVATERSVEAGASGRRGLGIVDGLLQVLFFAP